MLIKMSEFDNFLYEYKLKVYDGDDKLFQLKKMYHIFEMDLFKIELTLA